MNDSSKIAEAIRDLTERLQSGKCCWGDFLRACPEDRTINLAVRSFDRQLEAAFAELREVAKFGHGNDPNGAFKKLHTIYMMEVEVAYGRAGPDFFEKIGR